MRHPLGVDRKTRIDRWQAVAAFGDDTDPWVQVARLVVKAAEAPTDKLMVTRALFALGLHGGPTRKTRSNTDKLREAIQEFRMIVDAVYAPPDPEDGEPPFAPHEASSSDWKRYEAMMKDGAAHWLYRRVKRTAPGGELERAQTQFLHRVVDDESRPCLNGRSITKGAGDFEVR